MGKVTRGNYYRHKQKYFRTPFIIIPNLVPFAALVEGIARRSRIWHIMDGDGFGLGAVGTKNMPMII